MLWKPQVHKICSGLKKKFGEAFTFYLSAFVAYTFAYVRECVWQRERERALDGC